MIEILIINLVIYLKTFTSAIENPKFHQQSKHIGIQIHYVLE
jgi:hypothetical protein